MASTFTAYLNLEKQGAGDNSGTWGTVLNANYDILDNVASGATAITPDINGGTVDGAAIGASVASSGAFTTVAASGDVNFNSGGFFYDQSLSRVGIGTASPSTPFHLVDANPTLRFQDSDGTSYSEFQCNSFGQLVFKADVNNTGSSPFVGFQSEGANVARLNASGLRVGSTASSAAVGLDVNDFTDAVALPSGTTAQRPTGVAGYFRYNSTEDSFEGYTTADGWGAVGGGGGGYFKGENGAVGDATTGPGDIFRINEQELNTSTTIGATENASCAGPLAVASGITLTVTSGGSLVIL